MTNTQTKQKTTQENEKHEFVSDFHNACQICGKGKRVELHKKTTQGEIRKRCEFCGHLLDAPNDNRSMASDTVDHGRRIVEFLIREGFTAGHICNFCYAHVSIFKLDRPEEYKRLNKPMTTQGGEKMTKEERAIKIKVLEEIKEELGRHHSTLREGFHTLKRQGIFYRDADEMFLREMASIHLAELQLNKILYPLYHEIQRENGDSKP